MNLVNKDGTPIVGPDNYPEIPNRPTATDRNIERINKETENEIRLLKKVTDLIQIFSLCITAGMIIYFTYSFLQPLVGTWWAIGIIAGVAAIVFVVYIILLIAKLCEVCDGCFEEEYQ